MVVLGFCSFRLDFVFCLEQWEELWVEDWESFEFQVVQRGYWLGVRKFVDFKRYCDYLVWVYKKIYVK